MADRVGQQFGNYQLVRLLGKGGFADVYLGEHIHLNTSAAIKVLHTELAGHNEIENFRDCSVQTLEHLIRLTRHLDDHSLFEKGGTPMRYGG